MKLNLSERDEKILYDQLCKELKPCKTEALFARKVTGILKDTFKQLKVYYKLYLTGGRGVHKIPDYMLVIGKKDWRDAKTIIHFDIKRNLREANRKTPTTTGQKEILRHVHSPPFIWGVMVAPEEFHHLYTPIRLAVSVYREREQEKQDDSN